MTKTTASISDDLLALYSGDGRWRVAVIEAYFDESAKILIGKPVYAVGAFFGTRDEWRHFEQIWQPVLDVAGISYYHGKNSKCDKLRRPMVSAIRSSGVRGVTQSVFRDDYIKGGGRELKSILGNHYAFLCVSAALYIRDWTRRTNNGPIAVVLEDGQPNVEHVARVIHELLGADVVSVASAGKRDFLGLQAADFLAHHTAALDVGLAWVQPMLGDGPGQVMWGHLEPRGIATMTRGMKRVLGEYRHKKKQRKRAAKATNKKDA
jgi:hypothetical protein